MPHLTPARFVALLPLLTTLCLSPVACSRRLQQTGHDPGPLRELSVAYLQATQNLNRAPKDADELVPFLAPGKDVHSLLVSPADGEPYVILWGTDPRQDVSVKPLVIGYEKQGRRGARMVFTAMGVVLMTERGFLAARFPDGHKPT